MSERRLHTADPAAAMLESRVETGSRRGQAWDMGGGQTVAVLHSYREERLSGLGVPYLASHVCLVLTPHPSSDNRLAGELFVADEFDHELCRWEGRHTRLA